jgi:hypothetical protein
MKHQPRRALFAFLLLTFSGCGFAQNDTIRIPFDAAHPLIGTLQSDPAHAAVLNDAGARGVTVGVGWDRAEPEDSRFDDVYLRQVRDRIAAFHAAGKFVALDLGIQYPPKWILNLPASRFIDQNGDAYVADSGSGDCGVNLVYRQEMRDKVEGYVAHLFEELGSDIDAVRLGGGRYGELGYPGNHYKTQSNAYWAFDPVAQGREPGLPLGVKPCPVSGWIPGAASPDHASARQFLEWYMESMQNYHDWQIGLARKYFSGPLFMLYPSIGGLRPGQLEAAVQDDAKGSTGPEKTGEVGRGFDTARFVAGIRDPRVVVYSTWLDGFEGSDDKSSDPAHWSPGHYLASLAAAHDPPLQAGGENTGHPDDVANMQLTFQRVRDNHLSVLFWAFEPTLFDGCPAHATVADFKQGISQLKP